MGADRRSDCGAGFNFQMIVTVACALSPISVSASWPVELFFLTSPLIERDYRNVECCGTRVGHHLRLDGNLHETGCPAALKAATTVAGVIVRGDVQHVVARLAERDVRR